MTLIRIEAGHFVAGLFVKDGRVTDAAPILSYMKGWTLLKVNNYCRKKDWTFTELGTVRPEEQDKPWLGRE